MLFNSYVFILVFLPAALAGFALLSTRVSRRAALGWLVLASLFYYGWWDPRFVPLLVGSMLFNYLAGRAIGSSLGTARGKAQLILAISANLALLGYFKYAGFFARSVSAAIGADWSIGDIVLPLAISFFTFQQIAYLVDVWWGKAKGYNLIDYALFVTFFPQLIAGPIVHHGEMLPQFERRGGRGINRRNLAIGLTIFALGLAKKVLLADSVAVYASPVFGAAEAGTHLTFAEAWLGALCYTLQIYFDFSGYSDMAIGIARLFGIKLPLNFNSPYKSLSVVDFWRRWHITLSRFLRDYLYIPLGGNRKGPSRRYVNLLLTMLLGGLWHGAAWTFVFWGLLHGLYLCINHAWYHLVERLGWRHRGGGPVLTALSCGITFLAVVVAWVFFRAESFRAAGAMLQAMAGLDSGEDAAARASVISLSEAAAWAGGCLFWVWCMPNTQEVMRRFKPALDYDVRYGFKLGEIRSLVRFEWKPDLRGAIVVGVLLYASLALLSRYSEFIYYDF